MANSRPESVAAALIRKELLRYWNESNLPQEQVAARLGISRRALQYVLRGQRRPNLATGFTLISLLQPSRAGELLNILRRQLGTLGLPLMLFLPDLNELWFL